MAEKKYYTEKDHLGPGWCICGPNVRIGFEEKSWAEIVCRFMNGQYNAAKGMLVEWEKRQNVDPLDGRAKVTKG